MSEGNNRSGHDRRTPPTEDDKSTAEMTAAARQGAESASRPVPQNGQRPATPQPSASGWTPPPLPGRQTPQPPEPRPTAQGAPAQTPGAQRPSPTQPLGQSSGATPTGPNRPGAAAEANGRPSGLPLPTPAPDRSGPPEPQASTQPEEPSGPPEATVVPRQQSLWQRVTEGLGFERKSASPAASDVPSDSTAPAEVSEASAPVAPLAGALGAPSAKAPAGPSAGPPTAVPQYRVDGRAGGPQDRTAPTTPVDPPIGRPTPPTSPGQPVPGVRPGSPVSSGAAATAIVPAGAAVAGSGRSTEILASGPKPGATPARRTRKARLRLSRLDPWSVMKTSFLFSIAAGIMLVVAVYAVWAVLSASGLFSSINDIVSIVVATPGDTTPFEIQDYASTQRVMGVAALIACVDVLIFTALATLASFLYNLAATMLGGLEITLAED